MRALRSAAVMAALLVAAAANGSDDVPLTNWPSPLLWQPAPFASHGPDVPGLPQRPERQALALPSPALTFVAISPCRRYDSRTVSPLLDNTSRTVTLTGGACGIPASAQAASVNITVFNITGAGSNGVLKVGVTSPPATAWINYPFTETQRANAGVVALTAGGAIVLQVNQGAGSVDITVDVNGYYAQPQGSYAHLLGVGSVLSDGSVYSSGTNLGTWTPSRLGEGSYGVSFPGLRPGCVGQLPTVLVSLQGLQGAGFVYVPAFLTTCATGDVRVQVSTRSTADVAADSAFNFSAYGPAPVASAFSNAGEGRLPSTCTFIASTGVETCD